MSLEGKSSGLARAISEGLAKGETGEYEAKAILLTGGAGFIASHVAIRLVNHYPNTKVGPAPAFPGPGVQPGALLPRVEAVNMREAWQLCWPSAVASKTYCWPDQAAPARRGAARDENGAACAPQVVVLDKLDYCSSLKNLQSVKDKSNFKVREAWAA